MTTKYEVSTSSVTAKTFSLPYPAALSDLEEMIAEVHRTMPDGIADDNGPVVVDVEKKSDVIVISYIISRSKT